MADNTALGWGPIMDHARQAAGKVARNYPGIDSEDIEQSIYTKFLEKETSLARANYGAGALYNLFVKWGTEYANDERVSSMHFSSQYHYTAKEIRTLCGEALFDREAFMRRVDNRDEEFALDPEEIIARALDLQAAFEYLPDAHKAVLHKRFVLNEPLNGTERKEMTRAIDRLAITVNISRSKRRTDHDGPGSRKVINNAAAQAANARNNGY
jgi:hypothetical protein